MPSFDKLSPLKSLFHAIVTGRVANELKVLTSHHQTGNVTCPLGDMDQLALCLPRRLLNQRRMLLSIIDATVPRFNALLTNLLRAACLIVNFCSLEMLLEMLLQVLLVLLLKLYSTRDLGCYQATAITLLLNKAL